MALAPFVDMIHSRSSPHHHFLTTFTFLVVFQIRDRFLGCPPSVPQFPIVQGETHGTLAGAETGAVASGQLTNLSGLYHDVPQLLPLKLHCSSLLGHLSNQFGTKNNINQDIERGGLSPSPSQPPHVQWGN